MDQKVKQRIFLSAFFFLTGVCFSTWASRIPTIKTNFQFNDAELGTLLLLMPISSLTGLPISGWLVSRFDSRVPILIALTSISFFLLLIGFANTTFLLATAICFFSFSLRIMNIAVNTQSIALQKKFGRNINASFHGLWSTGGIVGVGLSTLFVGFDIPMQIHLASVAIIVVIIAIFCYPHLLRNDRSTSGNKLNLAKPDPYIVYLGLLIFLASLFEGGMFDWSGVYFKDVVNEKLFTLGYFSFMIFMASSRFGSDWLIENMGMVKTFIFSSLLMSFGVSLAIVFPTFWLSVLGFCLAGLGTAAVVPMVFSLAGRSKKYSPGVAISIIATYSIAGMLIGPALIGYIAQAFHLRMAFITFAITALSIIPVSQLFFRFQSKQEKSE
jgi:MFS family permease